MKKMRQTACLLCTAALLLLALPAFAVSAVQAQTALITLFEQTDGTASTDLVGDKESGYAAALGDAVVVASVSGSAPRKLEWTADVYADAAGDAVQPAMTGGSKNPWGEGAYIELRVSTVGYTDLCFSACLGGSKKGPRDFQLQYSLDGVNYTDVENASYSITTNKTMETAFDRVALPAETENAAQLFLRMAVASDTLISGAEGLVGSTGGETAVNHITLTGRGEVRFFPQGDVDKNGTVNTTDIRRLLAFSVSGSEFDEQAALLADVNGDGDINTSDARTVLYMLVAGYAPGYSVAANASESGAEEPVVSGSTFITLNGTTATVEGSGATVDGNVVTISDVGAYTVTGTMTDGQIVVATEKGGEDVELTLSNASITSQTGSPLYIQSAENARIFLAEGTVNTLTDAASYTLAEGTDEPKAALFSADDLIISGSGTLVVNGNYHNGIHSKNDVKIKDGTVTVTAVDQGIHGKDSVQISGGSVTVTAGSDGIQSDNALEENRGVVSVTGGTVHITAGNDAVQAETALTVSGGSLSATTGGGSGSSPSDSDTNSYKGLKSNGTLVVTGGVIELNCKDDTLHAAGRITLAGGQLSLSSGDDGVHSDTELYIEDPTALTVTKSYEALEAVDIVINGGTCRVTSSDDGVNGAGGTVTSTGSTPSTPGTRPGMPGQTGGGTESSSTGSLTVNGGYLAVYAGGDGLDANGNIVMTGGTVIVHGPTSGADGSLDYDGTFVASGGVLIAVGSNGMLQTPSTSSTQNTICVNLSSSKAGGTAAGIKDASGNTVLAFTPSKAYQAVVVCMPTIQKGTTYTAYTGGSCAGEETDGLYTGSYSGGTSVGSATVSSAVTTIGSSSSGRW